MMPLAKTTNILAVGCSDAYVLTEVFVKESENIITVSTSQEPISHIGNINLMNWIRTSYETLIPPDPVIHIKQMTQCDILLSYYELEKPVLIECNFESPDDQRMTLEIKYKAKKLHC